MAICGESDVLFTFRLCCLTLERLTFVFPSPVGVYGRMWNSIASISDQIGEIVISERKSYMIALPCYREMKNTHILKPSQYCLFAFLHQQLYWFYRGRLCSILSRDFSLPVPFKVVGWIWDLLLLVHVGIFILIYIPSL